MNAPGRSGPITVIVLTHNEERNLSACLESVTPLNAAVFVVDSGSTDRTRTIAESLGAEVVTHTFETHAQQWAWALHDLPISTDWVLAIDADQRLTPELVREILGLFGVPLVAQSGFFLNRRQIFRGRWIRHGGYYPKYLLKLFRRDRVRLDPADLVDHHFHVTGPVAKLRGDLVEDNLNEAQISIWTAKHNRYAVLQAQHEFEAMDRGPKVGIRALLGPPDARTRLMKQIWARLPLFIRPCAYVFYRYIVRLGFLDGKEGFIFHVLQAFWYRLLVDVNIDELRRGAATAAEAGASAVSPAGRASELTK